MGLGQIQRKTKNPFFVTFFGLKDCGGFKGRREMSRYQVVPVRVLSVLFQLIFNREWMITALLQAKYLNTINE